MNDPEFHAACAFLEDNRRMIAAGKLQRWDVVKWTVTVNIALATAAVALQDTRGAGMQLLALAVIVAGIGLGLMLYYNLRLTRTRIDSLKPEGYLAEQHGVNFATFSKKPTRPIDWLYDREELAVFALILTMSVVPICLVWKFFG
jgi:hypothetical protein